MKEKFFSRLETHFQENLNGINPLQKCIREKAWERFLEIGLPTKQHPGYQYFPLSQLYREVYEHGDDSNITKEEINPFIKPECRCSYIAFINGRYSPELSDTSRLPEGVILLRLKDALKYYGNFLQARFSKILKEETDPFATLNIALIQVGLFIYVPPNVIIDTPIQCLHFISPDKPIHVHPRVHFFVGSHSKMHWITTYHSLEGSEYFSNSVIDVAVEDRAIFKHERLFNPKSMGWCFETSRITLKRESHFKSLTCTNGSKSHREDFRVTLLGENASCDLKGIAMLSENRQAHVNVFVDHKAPHCQSNQLFKNILNDMSKASFEGKILVQPKAQKTKAYQLNNTLLLSDKAMTNSKPNLEIFADDVKASHGATVTQLPEEHLYYLRTRGIPLKEAKKLLLAGFSLEILRELDTLSLSEEIQHFLQKYLT